ncbi:hypothetical protein ARAM_000833 [Aspergillus rambellii]|uniref:Uncharacterized protein n=3 Tax=Aspergillus subgen. Nidulantes TaxID=2720870 RepID=A0A0F8U1X2_9EURO|nr:hypothetical protein AOCH_004916 [Aspergillus ochraceoroseus]KKK13714.1 hypothetical protein ARAM_000833 [Aspergillus rambellii]
MAPSGGNSDRPPDGGTHVQTDHSLDPHTSIEDYSRIMLEYTQRRMVDFADVDDDKGYATSRSSRSSNTSGKSGVSTSGLLARQAQGFGPLTKIGNNSSDEVQGKDFATSRDAKSSV